MGGEENRLMGPDADDVIEQMLDACDADAPPLEDGPPECACCGSTFRYLDGRERAGLLCDGCAQDLAPLALEALKDAKVRLASEHARAEKFALELDELECAVDDSLPEYDEDGEGEPTANKVSRIEYAGIDLDRLSRSIAKAAAERDLALSHVRQLECALSAMEARAERADAWRAERVEMREALRVVLDAWEDFDHSDQTDRHWEAVDLVMKAARPMVDKEPG